MRVLLSIVSVCLVWVATTVAQDLSIIKTGATKTMLDVSSLKQGGGKAEEFVNVIQNDLTRSGWFKVVKDRGATIRLHGEVGTSGETLTISLELLNTATGRPYFSRKQSERLGDLRRVAHALSDDIVKAVRGKRGMASTRIALIGSLAGKKNLYVCDSDGRGITRLTKDDVACLSPAWDPSGDNLYYTSFHKGFPDVYRIDMKNLRRSAVSSHPGVNAGPSLSRDGKMIALTLSRDGNPELYTMSVGSGRLTRLTRTRFAAEASPSWSPDGKQIVYVSDVTGSPHLYIIGRKGGQGRRLTRKGSQNVAPDWGTTGKIVFSSRRDGAYHLVMYNPETRKELQLTRDAADHEEPSWAPDGRHIVYVRTKSYRMELYVLDTLGDPEIRLSPLKGDWYSPAWSP
jgi:TolB protein